MWPNNGSEWLLLVRPLCFAYQMVTVLGEALAQIHHTDILHTCVREAIPPMGQCVASILIEHSKTIADFILLPQIPVSFSVRLWRKTADRHSLPFSYYFQ